MNIFKQNKLLKQENNELMKRVEKLEKENTDGMLKLREYYDKTIEHRLKIMECEYNTKIERKEQIIKICEKLEENLINNISSDLLVVSNDIDIYIKLLNYLKRE